MATKCLVIAIKEQSLVSGKIPEQHITIPLNSEGTQVAAKEFLDLMSIENGGSTEFDETLKIPIKAHWGLINIDYELKEDLSVELSITTTDPVSPAVEAAPAAPVAQEAPSEPGTETSPATPVSEPEQQVETKEPEPAAEQSSVTTSG